MEQHFTEDGDSAESIEFHTEALKTTIDESAELMAISAIQRCDKQFLKRLETGASLWVKEQCDPDAMERLGKTSAALVNTGRKQSALEMFIYFIILCGFTGTGFWLVAAPVWAYIAGVPVSSAIALSLSLSSDRN